MDMTLLQTLSGALTAIGWAFLPLCLLPVIYLIVPKMAGLTRFTSSLIEILDSISYRIGEIVKWGLVIMVVAIVVGVIALLIFGVSFTKLDEVPIYMHASVIMLGASATLLAGQHVRVDIFHSRFLPAKKALVDIIGFYLFILPLCLILLWMSQSFIAQSWSTFEGSSEASGIRGVFLLKTLIPLFSILICGQGLAIASRAALLLRGDALPPRPAHTPPLFGEPHSDNPVSGEPS